jgi:hypothetical protein
MEAAKRCKTEGCDNFAGSDGLCNACRRGEKPDTEKRKRDDEAAKAAEERARADKKRKLDDYRQAQAPCARCGGREVLTLYNKAPDNCYATLPSGRELEGGFPTLDGLTHHEGIDMKVCVGCGTIVGFDPEAIQAALQQEEDERAEQDN